MLRLWGPDPLTANVIQRSASRDRPPVGIRQPLSQHQRCKVRPKASSTAVRINISDGRKWSQKVSIRQRCSRFIFFSKHPPFVRTSKGTWPIDDRNGSITSLNLSPGGFYSAPNRKNVDKCTANPLEGHPNQRPVASVTRVAL